MNGTEVKITFYTSNHELTTTVSLDDTCTKSEGEDCYIGEFDGVQVKFTSIEQLAEVIYQGIMTTIEQFYNHSSKDASVLAFGNLLIPVTKVDAVKVEPVFFDNIPEENLVTVEVES